jgi:hypothetical protein
VPGEEGVTDEHVDDELLDGLLPRPPIEMVGLVDSVNCQRSYT